MSAMKMERNRRSSSGQKSIHINICYLFIKDQINKTSINIIYCHTDMMVADFFTKLLQGTIFRKLRNVIMGVTHPYSLITGEPPPVKEPVGKNELFTAVLENVKNSYVTGGGVKTTTIPNPSYADIVTLRGGEPINFIFNMM